MNIRQWFSLVVLNIDSEPSDPNVFFANAYTNRMWLSRLLRVDQVAPPKFESVTLEPETEPNR